MFIKIFFNYLSKFHYNSIYKYSKKLNFEIMIDIGCHEGELVSRFLQFKKIKNFFCFEPNNTLYKKLYKKYKLNKKIKVFDLNKTLFKSIAQKDFLLHAPYHKFLYVINFLLEASIDPKVKNIYITIYRLSKLSKVASALINAAKMVKKLLFKSSFRLDLTSLLILSMPKKCSHMELN